MQKLSLARTLICLVAVLTLGTVAVAYPPYYGAYNGGSPPGYAPAGGGYNYGRSTSFQGYGQYQNVAPGLRYNAAKQAIHSPGNFVHKNGRTYNHVGNGYYQNQQDGRIYNPTTGSYSTGRNLSFSPGSYSSFGNLRVNTTTGSVHKPGSFVKKQSGTYYHMGNGYYRNPQTGNVYNPYTQAY